MLTLHVQFTSGREVLGHYWGLLSGGGLALDLSGIELLGQTKMRGVRDCSEVSDSPPCVAAGAAQCSLAPEAPRALATVAMDQVNALLPPGTALRLEVHVCSIRKTYPLDVRLVELRNGKGGVQLVVAFLHSLPPDELLDAAWADGCDAPQRRSRRLPLRTSVLFERLDGGPVASQEGHLLNLSVGGCCVEGSGLPPPGTQVLLTTQPRDATEGPSLKLAGRVRWTEKPSSGLMGIEFLRPAPEVQALLQSQGLLPPLVEPEGER